MVWTKFMDMHSGGGRKLDFEYLFIEAPEAEAKAIFFNRFGRNPDRVTCTCCGSDYSIEEEESLEQATGYYRGCACEGDEYIESPCRRMEKYGGKAVYQTLADLLLTKRVVNGSIGDTAEFIFAHDIEPEERKAAIPAQGYVWVDEA